MDSPEAALGRKLLELSRLLLRENRSAEAETALLRAIAIVPGETAVYADLAGLRLKGGRFDEASQALEAGLKRSPGWVEGRLELARMHLRQARFAEARRELALLPDQARRSGPASALAGRLAAHEGDLEGAARLYRAALDAEPGSVDAALNAAEVLFRLGRDGEAVATLRAGPPPRGGEVHELSREFRRAFFARDFDAAFAVGERLLDKTRHPDPIDALRWPALIDEYDLTYPGKPSRDAAVEALARRGEDDPWAAYFLYVYRMDVDRGSARGAEKASQTLSRFDAKRYGWMRLECAKSRLYAGDFEGALEDFRASASATEPEHWMALCHEGETLVCLKRVDEGLSVMERAVAVATPAAYGNALAWKGEMLLWSGRYGEALPILEESRARGAQYAHTWIGGCLLKLGRAEEALEVLDRAVKLSFGDFEAKAWRAETLLALGRHAEAVAQCREALESGGRSVETYLRAVTGLALWKMGDASAGDEAAREIHSRTLALSRGVRRGGYAMRAWRAP